MTRDQARVLDWDACLNVRDLGGLPAGPDRRTRWGALVRGDTLGRLTAAGQGALQAHGVRTVVDLRFPEEIARDPVPHPFRTAGDAEGPRYVNVPINTGQTQAQFEEVARRFAAATTRAELNVLELDVNVVGVARACAAVARAEDGGVVVHCHAGKDRTGIVVAVLLALVGVADEVIAADYEMSAANLASLTRVWLDGITADPVHRAALVRLAYPEPEAILAGLGHVRARFGSIEAYLRRGGLADEELRLLRARLLEPAMPTAAG